MSKFTTADHRFAKAMRVDLGDAAPPPSESDEDDIFIQRLIAKIDSGEFDDETEEPTLQDWQEYSDQVEKEATQYHRNWKATERHLDLASRRNNRLTKALALSMVPTVLCIAGIVVHMIRRHLT